MLCGNKTDLRESYAEEGKTVIPTEKGEKLAKVRLYVNFLIWNTIFALVVWFVVTHDYTTELSSKAIFKHGLQV